MTQTAQSHRSFSRPGHFAARGFSLIELLVVISIFSLITTVILANHARFNGSVLLGSLAYDIGLSIREAQVFGLSVRQFANQFDIGYGVHFSDPASYLFFADRNTNNRYDGEGESNDSLIRNYAVGRGHTILRYCAETANGYEQCSDSSPGAISYLDIVFFRPDPDAVITTNELSTTYSRGKITVSSPVGETRTVTIESTGQISVTNP